MVLDDDSCCITAWKPCITMRAGDATETLDLALEAPGRDRAKILHKLRLPSDNGPGYLSGELAGWLEDREMNPFRSAPCHPRTQGKIERCHQTLKNRILLENHCLSGDPEQKIDAFHRAPMSATTKARKPHDTRRRLFRLHREHSGTTRNNQRETIEKCRILPALQRRP